jgi:L-threonine kinase
VTGRSFRFARWNLDRPGVAVNDPALALAYPSVRAAVPGTCGELVQGWHPEWDEPVLVSCPITRYSRVSVQLRPQPRLVTASGPGATAKLRQAAGLALQELNRMDLGASINVSTDLLPGRGMASSTADIVGVLAALSAALDRPFAPAELARLACRIEPSDSTMFAGLAALAYRGSGRYQELGPAPGLPLLMLDTGQAVDTVTYNARLDLSSVRALAATTRIALDWLNEGVKHNNPAAIGAAATLSAISYQAVSYNPLLPRVQQWASATGALGLIRAHSGSLFGLLYEPDFDLAEPARWLAARFEGAMTPTRLTGGYTAAG